MEGSAVVTEAVAEAEAPEAATEGAPDGHENDGPKFHLRQASPTDAVAVLKLLKRMHAESPVNLPEVSDAKALIGIVQAMLSGVFMLATDASGKKLIGALGVVRESSWFSDTEEFIDVGFYVAPEHRATGAAVGLVDAVASMTADRGYPLRIGTWSAGEDADVGLSRWFGQHGFTRAGGIYVRG